MHTSPNLVIVVVGRQVEDSTDILSLRYLI